MVLDYEDVESKRQQSSRRPKKNLQENTKLESDTKVEAANNLKSKKVNPTIKVTQLSK